MYCPDCGTANPDGAGYCRSCGSVLSQPAAANQTAAAPAPPPTGPPATPPADPPATAPAPTFAPPAMPTLRPAPERPLSRYLFMEPLLEHLSRGDLFKSVVSWALIVGGVLVGIGGVIVFFLALRITLEGTAGAVLAGLVLAIMAAVLTYMLVHTYFIRARTIQELPETHYAVVPIVAVILRMSGEVLAIYTVFGGLSIFVLALFLGSASPNLLGLPMYAAPGYGSPFTGLGGSGFLEGLVALIGAAVSAFAILLFFYMLAELAVVLVDIAQNTRRAAEEDN